MYTDKHTHMTAYTHVEGLIPAVCWHINTRINKFACDWRSVANASSKISGGFHVLHIYFISFYLFVSAFRIFFPIFCIVIFLCLNLKSIWCALNEFYSINLMHLKIYSTWRWMHFIYWCYSFTSVITPICPTSTQIQTINEWISTLWASFENIVSCPQRKNLWSIPRFLNGFWASRR